METGNFLTLFCFMLITTATVSYEDYSYLHDEDLPRFMSKPQQFSVELGDDITFPCEVDRVNEDYLMIFKYKSKKRDRMLFAGNKATRRDPRLRKEGSSFVLTNLLKSDSGEYVCRFETDPVVEVRHNLSVQYPASVHRKSPEIQKVVQGDTVSLECEANGNPYPAITWSKHDGRLPSGAQTEEGESITLEEVDRHVEGTYICTASNGIGEPANSRITVQVEYKPDILTETEIIQKQNGSFVAKLACIVHGRPSPKVNWFTEEGLVDSPRHLMHHDGSHRYSLEIISLIDKDFRTYTCEATNTHGTVREIVRLNGSPKAPNITSPPSGDDKRSYTLTWITESFAPIIQYHVSYRRVRENTTSKRPGKWSGKNYPFARETSTRDTRTTKGIQKMTHLLTNLNPNYDYEAKIRVETKFGWSSYSEIFRFHTRREEAVGHLSSNSDLATLYPGLFVSFLAAAVQSSTNCASGFKLFTAGLVLSVFVALL